MKNLLIACTLCSLTLTMAAENIEVNGIYYSLSTRQEAPQMVAEVAPAPGASYAGEIVIPAAVEVDGQTYTVVAIQQNGFANCSVLEAITLPPTITASGMNAFNNCSSLRRVEIADLDAWKGIAFANFKANPVSQAGSLVTPDGDVTSLTFSAAEGSVLPYVAAGIATLTEVTIEEGVTAIGEGAFQNASSLTTIDIPSTVGTIGFSAFSGCQALREVTLPEGLTEIASGLFSHSGLIRCSIPQSVKEIGAQAFMDCQELIAVALPDRLENISMRAFWESPRLRYLCCLNTTPPEFFTWVQDPTDYGEAFDPDIWPDCQLVIPVNYFSLYKGSVGWKNFRQWAYWHSYDVEINEIVPSLDQYTNREGETFILDFTMLPEQAVVTNKIIRISDPEIVSVEPVTDTDTPAQYRVTLLKEGQADITFWSGLCYATCHVTVDNDSGLCTPTESSSGTRTGVYTIDGRKLLDAATPDALHRLPRGLYLINGRKVLLP